MTLDPGLAQPALEGCAVDLRVRSHCRFRNKSTQYGREYGMKWMSGSTKRPCDRALVDLLVRDERGGRDVADRLEHGRDARHRPRDEKRQHRLGGQHRNPWVRAGQRAAAPRRHKFIRGRVVAKDRVEERPGRPAHRDCQQQREAGEPHLHAGFGRNTASEIYAPILLAYLE